MRRLYFVLPDAEIARKVEDDLLLARIDDRHIHFLANNDVNLQGLPKTGVMQRADALHGTVLGAFLGCLGGAALVATMAEFPEMAGFRVRWPWVLPIGVLGGLIGFWISGRSDTPHYHHEAFVHALEEGHVLVMIDVPVARVEEIRELIKGHYPQAEDHGIDPQIPAFP